MIKIGNKISERQLKRNVFGLVSTSYWSTSNMTWCDGFSSTEIVTTQPVSDNLSCFTVYIRVL